MTEIAVIGKCDCCSRTDRLIEVESRIAPVILKQCHSCSDAWCEPVELFNRIYPPPHENLEDWVMLIPLFIDGKYIAVDDWLKTK